MLSLSECDGQAWAQKLPRLLRRGYSGIGEKGFNPDTRTVLLKRAGWVDPKHHSYSPFPPYTLIPTL